MSFSKPTYYGMQQIFRFYLNNYMELLKLFPVYFVSFYLFLQLLRFRYKSIKPIEKVLRRRFINNFYISSKFPSPWSPFETPVLSYRKPLVRPH